MLTIAENRRILIIDDMESIHRDFRKTLGGALDDSALLDDEARLFGKAGDAVARSKFEIDSALQGQDGYEMVRRAVSEGRPYAMAFVDMRMPPGWDGVQTIKNLWREDPNLQVVICSAHSDYSWEQIVEQLGVSDRLLILKKPFDNAEVCQLANALTEKWHLSRRVRVKVEELECIVAARTEELRRLAMHDRLTGLANRELMVERLKTSLCCAETGASKFAVYFLDFDRFKLINDSLGHDIGDLLLISVAERLNRALARRNGLAARFGGDEFVLVLDDVKSLEDVTAFASELLATLRQPHMLRGHEVCSTASMGITFSDFGYGAHENLIRDADNAMYRAKTNGKDRFVLFDRGMHEQACERLLMEGELRRALARNELYLEYQPIIATHTGDLVGFEALMRWRHPVRGSISPALFIPIAEETGLICEMGNWALREACGQLGRWRKNLLAAGDLFVAVNISKRQLLEQMLLPEIRGILGAENIPANRLKLEVTESVIMDNPAAIIPVLQQFRTMGIGLAMDDFGTGHSSLTWLSRFPIDVLKIDRQFVTELSMNRQYGAIIQAIVTLAANMNMSVTAEGVETLEQLTHIQALDCQMAQGYYFAQPMLAEQCEALIASGKTFQFKGTGARENGLAHA
ncbi:MAG TPA: EAL domain-containing protein [Phycisphaerae bacterium]|nr:EAL domain-containing protein [Phycisphaerae bacterium]